MVIIRVRVRVRNRIRTSVRVRVRLRARVRGGSLVYLDEPQLGGCLEGHSIGGIGLGALLAAVNYKSGL